MDRRRFLRAVGAAGTATIAGCTGGNFFEVQYSPTSPPAVPKNRPNAVYYPSHFELMDMIGMRGMGGMGGMGGMSGMSGNGTSAMNDSSERGRTNGSGGMGGMSGTDVSGGRNDSGGMSGTSAMGSAGQYAVALTYSYAHRFWTVTGRDRKKVPIEKNDSMHLMVNVWDASSGVYAADASPTVKITQNGNAVATLTPWTMLSEVMGFHFGDNVSLPGDGTYSVSVTVPPVSTRRTGAFEGQFTEPKSFDFDLKYSQQKKDEIQFTVLEKKAGKRGSVKPMQMKAMPLATAPRKSEFPGRSLGKAKSGDGVFLMSAIDDASRLGARGKTYLAVSPRTPYNGFIMPNMSLSATVKRRGKTVFDGPLSATIDPELDYHYGAGVGSIESGDRVTITVDAPPQVARHEGYETAFLRMQPMRFTVR